MEREGEEVVAREQLMRNKFMYLWNGVAQLRRKDREYANTFFAGPALRARFLLERLEARALSGQRGDLVKWFWNDPRDDLAHAGPEAQALYERYVSSLMGGPASTDPAAIEWLGQILEDLVRDTGERIEVPEGADWMHVWKQKRVWTMHDFSTRMYAVAANAMRANPVVGPGSEIYRDALTLARLLAYEVSQMHIEEFEMSFIARLEDLDPYMHFEHAKPASLPARYPVPRVQRARQLIAEVLACPFAWYFRHASHFPDPGRRAPSRDNYGPSVRAQLFDAQRALQHVEGVDPAAEPRWLPLDAIQHKADAGGYGLEDPLTELRADLERCFRLALEVFANSPWLVAAGWRHPSDQEAHTGSEVPIVPPQKLADFAAVCLELYVDGVPSPSRGRPPLKPRTMVLRQLNDEPRDVDERVPSDALQPDGRGDAERKAQLIELLPQRDRDRIGHWLLEQQMHRGVDAMRPRGVGRQQSDVPRDTVYLELGEISWSELRVAFTALRILVGHELVERTRMEEEDESSGEDESEGESEGESEEGREPRRRTRSVRRVFATAPWDAEAESSSVHDREDDANIFFKKMAAEWVRTEHAKLESADPLVRRPAERRATIRKAERHKHRSLLLAARMQNDLPVREP